MCTLLFIEYMYVVRYHTIVNTVLLPPCCIYGYSVLTGVKLSEINHVDVCKH